MPKWLKITGDTENNEVLSSIPDLCNFLNFEFLNSLDSLGYPEHIYKHSDMNFQQPLVQLVVALG